MLFASVSAADSFGQNRPAADLKPVDSVDIKKYAGTWYEIAKYPNRFQKKCVANTTANYALKPNGRIEVSNQCLLEDGRMDTAVGEAKIVDVTSNAKLKVRFAPSILSFLPMVWGDYWIIDLDKDYEYVAVGEPKREYFWILSRKPKMDDSAYQAILRRAVLMGFDAGKVEKTPQNVEIRKGKVVVKT